MRLKRLGGLGYRGFDYDGKALVAEPGGEFECSDRRGERLLADYPGGFEVVGVSGSDAASGPDRSGQGDPPATTDPAVAVVTPDEIQKNLDSGAATLTPDVPRATSRRRKRSAS